MAENRVAQSLAEIAYNIDPENRVAQAVVEVAYRDSLNVLEYSGWEHSHAGYLITPWVTLNLLDVNKYFKSVKHFVENATSTIYISVDYRTDPDSSWTNVGTVTTVPSEENTLKSTDYVTGKRIQFRYRFYTDDANTTVDLNSWLLESIPSIPQKHSYTAQVRLEDDHITLFGSRQYQTISAAYNALKSMVDQAAPVTLGSNISDIYDGQEVKLTGVSSNPLVDYNGKQVNVATLTFIDT